MSRRPNVYGLDIETDTTVNGLDSEVVRQTVAWVLAK